MAVGEEAGEGGEGDDEREEAAESPHRHAMDIPCHGGGHRAMDA
jgi:hypothetical protein